MRLSEAIKKYIDQARLRLSDKTIEGYDQDLRYFLSWALASVDDSVLAFTAQLVTDYLVTCSKKVSLATLARRRAVLGEFARWGYGKRYFYSDMTATMPKIRRPKSLPRSFSPEEREKLMALELGPHERMLRGVLFYTGFRVSEAVSMRVGDFSPEVRTVRTTGKGGRDRVVPVPVEFVDLARTYIETHTDRHPRTFLFARGVDRHMTPYSAEYLTSKWGRRADVQACSPHRWRHTYATMLLERGADIRSIQKLLGHENIATTAGYLRVADAHLRDVVDLLSKPKD